MYIDRSQRVYNFIADELEKKYDILPQCVDVNRHNIFIQFHEIISETEITIVRRNGLVKIWNFYPTERTIQLISEIAKMKWQIIAVAKG
ncbi:MAG: hypothetical protein LBF71_05465 [Campylobacteraceae bacterium]|jgi:hypothetical protein|nr:hypothetical protein [Campylobacteraceae bacterium]